MIKKIFEKLRDSLFRRWLVCGIISDKKSVQYGLYFSYPIYILFVVSGILLRNPFVILIAALVAFLGIKLAMHPLDYVYNNLVAKFIRTTKIPVRGTELQVNSMIALVFNSVVLVLILLGISINYVALAIIYAFSSIFFISYFLIND